MLPGNQYSSQHQSITLSARLADNATLAVCVKDHGVGIDPEIQPYVFDLFTQAPRTLDRAEGGLGIGLSMVRSLVEMHGGTVSVYSEGLGHGSEFIVLLPVSGDDLAPEAAPVADAQAVLPCRILVIEDNVDANETLSFFLQAEGHSVASAFDGASGLEMAKDGAYDMVVCDIGLPGNPGLNDDNDRPATASTHRSRSGASPRSGGGRHPAAVAQAGAGLDSRHR